MGKNLNTGDLVKRSEGNLAFYGVPASTGTSVTFTRMEGFTDLSNSKNPSEYNRRYVDEDSDRTTNTGFAPEKSYTFDRYKGNTVHDDIIAIHDKEKIGGDAVRTIISVDLTTITTDGGTTTAKGIKRDYSVLPDSDGGSNDAMTYSGSLKACSPPEEVTVTTSDDWQTITIVE